jgi:histidinol-phosphate phosphatase family protein
MSNGLKVIFLDRDGTINVESPAGYVFKPADWQFIPHAIEALKILKQKGFALAVVTNQSGIGHDLYTLEDMQKTHDFMIAELKKEGVELDAIAFCPHARDEKCDCRKPDIGMVKTIEAVLGEIDYSNSWTIGDRVVDCQLGKNIHTKTVLLRSKYWQEEKIECQPDYIANSLYEAAINYVV